jgi:hypothetical protein
LFGKSFFKKKIEIPNCIFYFSGGLSQKDFFLLSITAILEFSSGSGFFGSSKKNSFEKGRGDRGTVGSPQMYDSSKERVGISVADFYVDPNTDGNTDQR